MSLPLITDPRTGSPLPSSGSVVGWRVQLRPSAGGRPRIVRDDGGPVVLERDSTEDDAREHQRKGYALVALGIDEDGAVVCQRPVGAVEGDDDDEAPATSPKDKADLVLTDATSELVRSHAVAMEAMGQAFAVGMQTMGQVLAALADRIVSGPPHDEADQPAAPKSADERLAALVEAVVSARIPGPSPVNPTPQLNGATSPGKE